MFEIKKRGNLIFSYATGKLNEEDYDRMIPVVEKTIDQHGKIRWYFQVDKFEGWTPRSFWTELKFDAKYRNNLEKAAIVGEERWQDWMTQVMKPFTSAEVRYFDETEKDKAEAWIKRGVPKTSVRYSKKPERQKRTRIHSKSGMKENDT